MNLVYNTITHFSPSTFSHHRHHPQYSSSAAAPRRRLTPVRASLPFPTQKAKYHRELEAAVAIVERACRICVDVQSSLLSIDGGIVEKKDNSPVTVADFGVQGLISYELGKLFPSIPLVAEEDSGFVRANNLVDSVVSVVNEKSSSDKPLSDDVVLEAIDRGGSAGSSFGKEPATYWVLDPIDGTKGFLKGCGALYVVGLALVVEGEIVAGIMGCPNWQNSESSSEVGAVMIAHTGCGTWIKTLQDANSWSKCSVDGFSLVSKSRFCIPESQSWKSLPLSGSFDTTYDADGIGNHEVHLMTTCCGSLCKYLMVASGRASVYIQAQREPILKSWDHAVGVICVHEAGGKVSDWAGSELDLAVDEAERRIIYPPGGILVTNGSIHKEILDIISLSSSVV